MTPRHNLLALVLCSTLSFPLSAQGPITDANWQRHPAIVQIRPLIQDVDDHLGALLTRSDSASCDGGRISLTAVLFQDSAGFPRMYHLEGGSDDSAGEVTFYYDHRGVVRFVFAVTNAVNGTQREDRAYFDSTGVQLYLNSRLLAGPGYPGGFATDPIRDPVADFEALCRPAQ